MDAHPLLRSLADDERALVLRHAVRRRHDRGTAVLRQDDPARTCHLVTAGRFSVARSAGTETQMLTVLGPGDTFGELALLVPGSQRTATVTALEDGETLVLTDADFRALRDSEPGVVELLIAILAAQVTRLSTHLAEALHVSAESRVRRRLLELTETYRDPAASTPPVVPLTQEQLGQLAGTTRPTVNAVLAYERNLGAIELGRGRVTVLDADALGRRAARG